MKSLSEVYLAKAAKLAAKAKSESPADFFLTALAA
jgi:hypothetical protein